LNTGIGRVQVKRSGQSARRADERD